MIYFNWTFSGQVAALHYNENSSRKQVVGKEGVKGWRISYPKYKGGAGVPKEVKTPMTYGKYKCQP